MKSFKIIYGENGIGKTKYYEKKQKDVNYICIDYNVGEWYDEKEKTLSQRNFLIKEISNKITKHQSQILSTKGICKIFDTNITNLKNFLKNNKFSDHSDWFKYKSTPENVDDEINVKNYANIFNIWAEFDTYNNIIKGLGASEFELLKVYSSLSYSEVHNLKENKPIELQDKILSIMKELSDNLGIDKIDELLKLGADNLDKIWNTEININYASKIIKDIFIKDGEVKKIFSMIEDKNKIEKNCLNFGKIVTEFPDNIKISDDGYDLQKIDLAKPKYSDGQKIAYLLQILLKVFSATDKTIVFDDVFEKLDFSNTFDAIYNLLTIFSESENMKIEILTHDTNFIDVFIKILDSFADDIKIEYLIMEKNDQLHKTDFTFTFSQYLVTLYNHLNDKNKVDVKTYNDCLLLSKLFNRQAMHNNWTQIYNYNHDYNKTNNLTNQVYNFLSENIFHYEENINLLKYDLIQDYFNDEIFNKQNLNTLELYEILIVKFKNMKPKFGVNFIKVSAFLENLKKFIKCEQEYFNENKFKPEHVDKTKKEFYRDCNYKSKNEGYVGNENPRRERCKLAHELEKSILIFK